MDILLCDILVCLPIIDTYTSDKHIPKAAVIHQGLHYLLTLKALTENASAKCHLLHIFVNSLSIEDPYQTAPIRAV